MKVIQVIPYLRLESSGPTQSVPGMCRGLQHAGCEVTLHSDGPAPNRDFGCPTTFHEIKVFPHPKFLRSPAMLKQLKVECQTAQIIHNNSLWAFPNVYPLWAIKGTACKQVLQPRGTLSEWALNNSKWKKRLFGWLFQYKVMRKADLWIATCEEEYQDIRRLGYKQPVAILPNGVDLPNGASRQLRVQSLEFGVEGPDQRGCDCVDSNKQRQTANDEQQLTDAPRRRMFFLSRIHPKKNVELLLRCWAKLEPQFPEWDLSIVGPDKDNSYADEMKQLAKALGCQRVIFEGELNGEEKYRFMAESECEVLPTHSENFGMVVAEALACKTPVICSYGAPWSGLNDHKCGWWVPTTERAFLNAMTEAMSKTREELSQMGERGREWMARDFSWDGIGAKMKAAYAWLLGQGEKPDFVRVD